jgi:hypothetical protein
MKYNLETIDMICWYFDKKYSIITIENDKSKTPNFHIVDRKTMGDIFDCQISISSPVYIKTSKSKLNKDQIRKLDKLWIKKFNLKKYGTYWNWMIDCWNAVNYKQIPNNKTKPDYNKLQQN